LVEHLTDIQKVIGSSPMGMTNIGRLAELLIAAVLKTVIFGFGGWSPSPSAKQLILLTAVVILIGVCE
jgi:hypothetical protein